MRDIPFFTTENGVAGLTLGQIPYTGKAYIKIHSTLALQTFLAECRDFCRAVGAQSVFASGHSALEDYSLSAAILEMGIAKEDLPHTDGILQPLTDQTLESWQQIYNERMAPVDNAACMTREAGRDLLRRGGGWFVYRQDRLLGIGIASENRLEAVASAVAGGGRDTALALCQNLSGPEITLEVASTNQRAIRLYESLGFQVLQEVSRWYRI